MSKDPTELLNQMQHEVALLERQLEAVRQLAGELSSVARLEETVQRALETSLEVVDARAGSILLHDPKKDKLVFRHVVGEKAAELTGVELNTDQGIAGSVFQAGEIRVTEDVSRAADHLWELGERIQYQTRNMVTVPLKTHLGRCIGVMQVLNKADGHFNDHDVATLDILASQVAAGIEAAMLQEEARLAQVVNFIGDISHDVKNMITPVQTSAETLRYIGEDCFSQFDAVLQDALAEPERRQAVSGCLEDLRTLLPEMVELILDGAEAVQQRMAEIAAAVKGLVSRPHFERADIVDVARRAVALLEHQGAKTGVNITVEHVDEIPHFPLDKKRIYNAVYNLVFNALGACAEGATITLRISAQPEGTFPDGAFCRVDCVDTGSGMPDHVRRKLFTDDAISTKPMGTGLGTRIIKNVVDAHEGVIQVESQEGVGTTISFRIPLDREETAATDEQ